MNPTNSWARGQPLPTTTQPASQWGPTPSNTTAGTAAPSFRSAISQNAPVAPKQSVQVQKPAAFSAKAAVASSSSKKNITKNAGKIKVVSLDGATLLQIIKHCTDSQPDVAAGTLLGLDFPEKEELEVTHSFAVPCNSSLVLDKDYQMDMLHTLCDFNFDNNVVGWYVSTADVSAGLLEMQYSYQKRLDSADGLQPRCVVLLYDPANTRKGRLALKAYRLTENFMKNFEPSKTKPGKKSSSGTQNEYNVNMSVLEEIPIKLTNCSYNTLYVNSIASSTANAVKSKVVNLSTGKYLEESVEKLVSEVEEYLGEQGKWSYYERGIAKQKQQQLKWLQNRRSENKVREERGEPPLPEVGDSSNPAFKYIEPPNRIDMVVARNNLGVCVEKVNKFVAGSLPKIYAAAGLQQQ